MIYFIYDPDSSLIKIGKAVDVQKRMNAFLTSNPNIQLLGTKDGYTEEEADLHQRFAQVKAVRKWFWPSKALLDEIKKTATSQDSELIKELIQKNTGKQSFKPKPKKAQEAPKKSNTVDRFFFGFALVCLLIIFFNTRW